MAALNERAQRTGESMSRTLDAVLSEAFELERHSLFQVSTSSALVQGVFGGPTTVAELKNHGDFGLGTFSGLDGEMILIDGECFRATAGGAVSQPSEAEETPFALVTWFHNDIGSSLDAASLDSLQEGLDAIRPSENIFAAIRVEGLFDELSMRAVCRALPGESLVEAAAHQSEFEATDVRGTLVGFWAPPFSRSVSVPGYHFHFIAADRDFGGHILGLTARDLTLQVHLESDIHLALPETAEFLAADLRGDHQAELTKAETARRPK